MLSVSLQQFPALLKQTFFETIPSAAEGLPLFNQPGKSAPHVLGNGHEIGIFVPAGGWKRYQPVRFESH